MPIITEAAHHAARLQALKDIAADKQTNPNDITQEHLEAYPEEFKDCMTNLRTTLDKIKE